MLVHTRMQPLKELVRPFFRMHRLVIYLLLIAAAIALISKATGQSDFTRVYGPEDQTIPIPQSTISSGQKDASALQEILDFVKATDGGTWGGLQASGTLVSGSIGGQSPATLLIGKAGELRLDVSAAQGPWSIATQGMYGQSMEADGSKHRLSSAMSRDGLFAFPRLFMRSFPDALTSVLERGTISIDGRALHRITVERSVSARHPSLPTDPNSAIDMYFDSTTHLLIKSAISVQIDPTDRERYLLVMTYSDYRSAGQTLLPFSYHQTLNGQPQWTLQLNNLQLNPAVNPSQFHF